MKEISDELYERLDYLGIIPNEVRSHNVGKSDYSSGGHVIQPWSIIQDYNLNYWDGDIIKRGLRTKAEEGMTMVESRILDYKKIIHICQERLRQLSFENSNS